MGTTSTPPAANAAPTRTPERLGPVIATGAMAKEKSAVYWVGVIPWKKDDHASRPPPMHFMNIGPVTFQTWTTPWEGKDESGAGIRGRYPGALVRLTESQVARLKSELMRTVVRWRERKGQHAHGYLVRQETMAEIEEATKRWKLNEVQVAEATAKIAVFREDDEPVSMFVYCVLTDLPEGGTARPGNIPASAWDTGITMPGMAV